MRLRKTLTLAAAVLTAGLLSLSPSTQANNPAGGPIASVWVNNVLFPPAAIPVNGIFKGGNMAYGGGVFGCVGGNAAGVVERGPRPLPVGLHDLTFTALNLNCNTSLGIAGVIAVNPVCTVFADFASNNVHNGTVDTGPIFPGAKFHRVPGSMTFPPGCVTITAGPCTAQIVGTVPAYFDEFIKNVAGVNYQDLILNGPGLAFANQNFFCLGLLAGPIVLNNITFNIQVAPATMNPGGIDFRP